MTALEGPVEDDPREVRIVDRPMIVIHWRPVLYRAALDDGQSAAPQPPWSSRSPLAGPRPRCGTHCRDISVAAEALLSKPMPDDAIPCAEVESDCSNDWHIKKLNA
jgi:hypothetical protein